MQKTNLELLRSVAQRLGALLPEVVFVGGCTTGLFITDKAAPEVRPTVDVDAIAEIVSYAAYEAFAERLRRAGFREDSSEQAPVCRWLIDDVKLDVMPTEARILGFTNRWYRDAMSTAIEMEIGDATHIRVVTAPFFVATKLEAFKGRGGADYTTSRDLEDLMAVLDGRPEIVDEIARAHELCSFIAGEFRQMLRVPAFLDALPGHLLPDRVSQERLPILVNRMRSIAELRTP